MRNRYLGSMVAAVLVLSGGCGGGNGSSHSGASGGGGGAVVSMHSLRFDPSAVTVRVGQAVVWTNNDAVDHNVTATSGASFHSRAFGPGQTFRFVATRPGTVRYVCTLHPGMMGSLTVLH
jgi:plastocyanin